MNRAQRILKFVAGCKQPTSLHAIAAAVADKDAGDNFTALVSAQLHQLTKAGKLKRTGKPYAYRYAATPRTLVDGRKIGRDGKPRTKSRDKAAASARRAPTTPGLLPTPARKAATRKVTDSQRIVITPAADRATAQAGARETVAEFLARGGRIQKLKPGECSSPLYESVRALNARTMRQRLAAADNADDIATDTDLDTDDAADIAALAATA